MAFRLPRLRSENGIVAGGKPTLLFTQWWQSVVKQIEDAITSIQTVLDALTGVEGSVTGLQAHDNILDGVVALGTDTGLIEKTGASTFEVHAIGADAPASIPTRLDADNRYLRQDGAVAVSAATPSTHKLTVTIGGATYYILLTNV